MNNIVSAAQELQFLQPVWRNRGDITIRADRVRSDFYYAVSPRLDGTFSGPQDRFISLNLSPDLPFRQVYFAVRSDQFTTFILKSELRFFLKTEVVLRIPVWSRSALPGAGELWISQNEGVAAVVADVLRIRYTFAGGGNLNIDLAPQNLNVTADRVDWAVQELTGSVYGGTPDGRGILIVRSANYGPGS